MVVEIALDFELVPEADTAVLSVGIGKVAPEPLGEDVVAAKRHLCHHARCRKALPRAVTDGGVVVVATTPLRVEPNCAATNGTPGNLLGSRLQARTDGDKRTNAIGIRDCPLKCLHAAHRAADHRMPTLHAQHVGKSNLRTNHVANGDDRKP